MINLIRLWKFSAQIQTELVLGSRIKATGDNKEAVLDRYKDDLEKLKSNSRLNSLFISSILILPAFIAVQSISQSMNLLGSGNIDQIFFANSVAIASYYVFNFVFMLIFGLMTIASLLDGQIFKFLHTLPFSKSEIQILGMMSFVRLLLYQIVIMVFVFPLGMAFISGSFIIFGITFAINLVNLILGCYTLIIVIDKMTGLLFSQNQKFGVKTILRYLFFVVYILVAFSIYYFVGSIGRFLDTLYQNNILPETTIETINLVLPFVAFPFSTGYLISIITLSEIPSNGIILSTFIGISILVLFTILVVRSGNRILLNMAYKSSEFKDDTKMGKEIKVETDTPLISYIRLNFLILSRDLSSLISITMAILFPILPLIQGNNQDLFVTFLFYSGFIIFFSANALSVTEGSVGGLLSSLPVPHKLMLRGKQMLIGLVYILAFTILTFASAFEIFSIRNLILIILLAVFLPNTFLISKSRLFGKINNEYTLFDIEDTNNILRNIILIIPVMMIVGLEFAVFYFTDRIQIFINLNEYLIIFVANVAIFLSLEVLNHIMYKSS